MTELKDKSISGIKNWLIENKVLFVTNTPALPGSMFLSSIGTYAKYIPVHNFHIIPGINNGKPFYGVDAFLDLVAKCASEKLFMNFNYVIYIDEDAFITDFETMLGDFIEFAKDDEFCLGGVQDGGVLCHRNHQHIMINTFISFWNMKLLRESTTPEKILEALNDLNAHKGTQFEYFKNQLIKENKELFDALLFYASAGCKRSAEYRRSHFKNGESDYCKIVKNDPSNPVEPHQSPYSTTYGVEKGNFEPYYLVEEMLVMVTGKPIYYMFASDYVDEEDPNTDNSGLSSAVFDKTGKLYCVHTWFSRAYSKWPLNKVMLTHTNRINKVIMKYGFI